MCWEVLKIVSQHSLGSREHQIHTLGCPLYHRQPTIASCRENARHFSCFVSVTTLQVSSIDNSGRICFRSFVEPIPLMLSPSVPTIFPFSLYHSLSELFGHSKIVFLAAKLLEFQQAKALDCFSAPVLSFVVLLRCSETTCERLGQIPLDLSDPTTQGTFVDFPHSQLRYTTCTKHTVAAWTQSHDLRR